MTPSASSSGTSVGGAGALEGHAVPGHRSEDVLRELRLDGREQLLLDLRDRDLADQVVEEPVHDQAAGLVLGDAARAQVEQLLVVEAAGGRGVAGALDLAGLDLEVRHRVGLAAVGEHEVAVLLVGLDALGDLADQHVPDPHGVRALALQRALVDRRCSGVRRGVVDEQPVLDVLARRRRSTARASPPSRRGRRTRAVVSWRTRSPPKVTSTCAERRVAADLARAGVPACTASSAQSSMLTTVSWAPSPTTISAMSARVADPVKRNTTVALLCASALTTTWVARGAPRSAGAGHVDDHRRVSTVVGGDA